MVATILWPLSLFSLAHLASADLRADYGLPADFSSWSIVRTNCSWQFCFSLANTWLVHLSSTNTTVKHRDDPDVCQRNGGYVEAMEHWININKDYYEREHARLTADLPKNNSSEE